MSEEKEYEVGNGDMSFKNVSLNSTIFDGKGGDEMKVYEITFVDKEKETIIFDEKVAAKSKENALIKVDEPKQDDYGVTIKDHGVVS